MCIWIVAISPLPNVPCTLNVHTWKAIVVPLHRVNSWIVVEKILSCRPSPLKMSPPRLCVQHIRNAAIWQVPAVLPKVLILPFCIVAAIRMINVQAMPPVRQTLSTATTKPVVQMPMAITRIVAIVIGPWPVRTLIVPAPWKAIFVPTQTEPFMNVVVMTRRF